VREFNGVRVVARLSLSAAVSDKQPAPSSQQTRPVLLLLRRECVHARDTQTRRRGGVVVYEVSAAVCRGMSAH
jgi:hypothetical protein